MRRPVDRERVRDLLGHLTTSQGRLLVHQYSDVDDGRVYDAIREKLTDFDAFRRELSAWMAN